ncbi:MAG: glycosyltransferase family 1 protein, partial [Verrucomicrobia bacterium]|nr:glycosyltransferase family 1 protein [Verrucomicrobiota bacterium]
MKILLLTHAFHPLVGGLETVAKVLANEFCALGHEV